MSNLTVFEFNSKQVRIIEIDGNPWFVATDVCDILSLRNVTRALERLKDYEKGVTTIKTLGGNQESNCISESGLYRLVLTSRKPQAEPFQDWVVQEVLPSIRKTGLFSAMPFKLSDDSSIASFEGDDYWTTTITIAELFGKDHRNVTRDIQSALDDALKFEQMSDSLPEFKCIDITYIDSLGRTQRAFKINRSLFNYVVLAYQGNNAKMYRMMFIKAFEVLEQKVKVFLTQQMIYSNPKRQHVYVLQNTVTGMVKVGITNDISRRVSELQNASGCEIEVKFLSPKCDNARDIETAIHQMKSSYRGIGEWFDISPKDAIDQLSRMELTVNPCNGF